MNKNEKLAKLNGLLHQIHGGATLRDIRRVYHLVKRLPEAFTAFIYSAQDGDELVGKDPKYVPLAMLEEACMDDKVWESEGAEEDIWIFKGRDIVALLDKLKAHLGPDPLDAVVLYYADELYLTTPRDTTTKELDQYIAEAQEYVEEDAAFQELQTVSTLRNKQQREVNKLVGQLGHERVIDLLSVVPLPEDD